MKNTPSLSPIYLTSITPYVLVGVVYEEMTDGDSTVAFYVTSVLLFVRLLEMLGSVVSWRFHGKKIMVNEYLEIFRSNKFPKREFKTEDLSGYLSRIEYAYSDFPNSLKVEARQIMRALEANRIWGIPIYMRVNSAAVTAFDIYSPKSEAPPQY